MTFENTNNVPHERNIDNEMVAWSIIYKGSMVWNNSIVLLFYNIIMGQLTWRTEMVLARCNIIFAMLAWKTNQVLVVRTTKNALVALIGYSF